MPKQLPPEVRDKPPAYRLVWLAIEGEVHDVDTLVDATGLSKRRIRDAANYLAECGLINSYRLPSDQRRRIYFDAAEHDLISAQQAYSKRQAEN